MGLYGGMALDAPCLAPSFSVLLRLCFSDLIRPGFSVLVFPQCYVVLLSLGARRVDTDGAQLAFLVPFLWCFSHPSSSFGVSCFFLLRFFFISGLHLIWETRRRHIRDHGQKEGARQEGGTRAKTSGRGGGVCMGVGGG